MFNLQDGGLYEFKLYCAHEEQCAINVIHFSYAIGADGPATSTGAMEAISDIVRPLYADVLSFKADYRGISIQEMNVGPPGTIEFLSSPLAGEVTGDMLPRQTCGLITKVPASGSGFRKGRCYVPFPSEDDNDESAVPSTTYVTRLEALAAGLFQVYNLIQGVDDVGVLTPRLWRRGGGTTAIVTGTSVRRKWATQRRRGSYGRANFSPV